MHFIEKRATPLLARTLGPFGMSRKMKEREKEKEKEKEEEEKKRKKKDERKRVGTDWLMARLSLSFIPVLFFNQVISNLISNLIISNLIN